MFLLGCDRPRVIALADCSGRHRPLSASEAGTARRPRYGSTPRWLFELHRAALGEYIEQTWGWDEALQQKLFAEAFDRLRGQIILGREPRPRAPLVEENADKLYLLRLVLLPAVQNQGLGTARRQAHSRRGSGVDVKFTRALLLSGCRSTSGRPGGPDGYSAVDDVCGGLG